MRKKVFGRKLKRDANERKALLKGLLSDLVIKEKIQTTEAKAQAIRGQVEKLVTKAKNKGEDAVRLLQPYLTDTAVEKVMHDLAYRFADRPGGYVRVVKLGSRFGDNARVAVIEWVEKTSARAASSTKTTKEKTNAVEKKEETKKIVKPTRKTRVKKESK